LLAGLFGASLLAASVVPLSTSYAFAEAAEQTAIRFGKCQRSPQFYGIFIDQIMIGAGIALVRRNFASLVVKAQILTGIITPLLATHVVVARADDASDAGSPALS
jgi:hypothetical protein